VSLGHKVWPPTEEWPRVARRPDQRARLPHVHRPRRPPPAPQPLSSGRNVFEEPGRGFTLLASTDDEVDRFRVAAERGNVPFAVVRDTYADGREAYGSRLILVRPDQFVAWTGDEAPDDVDRLLRTVTGRG
jgi:hypothetical protein